MEGTTALSNTNQLSDKINEGINIYRNFRPADVDSKCEIWIRGFHANSQQIQAQWEAVKEFNVNINSKKHLVDKIIYHGPDGFTELVW